MGSGADRDCGLVAERPLTGPTGHPSASIEAWLRHERQLSIESIEADEQRLPRLESGEAGEDELHIERTREETIEEVRRQIEQEKARKDALRVALRQITTTPSRPGWVILGREERETLFYFAARELELVEFRLQTMIDGHATALDSADRPRRQTEALFRALDEIGWEQKSEHDRFEVTASDELVEFLARWQESYLTHGEGEEPGIAAKLARLLDLLRRAEPARMCQQCGLEPGDASLYGEHDGYCLTCVKAMVQADQHGASTILEAMRDLVTGIVDRCEAAPDDILSTIARATHDETGKDFRSIRTLADLRMEDLRVREARRRKLSGEREARR